MGRSFPVETRWLDTPLGPKARRTDALVDLVTRAEAETRKDSGGILVFLPGEGEIRRAAQNLTNRLPGDCLIQPLFGALPFKDQQAAIRPANAGRKIVLATSIAETSLTIQDIRVVVDMGQARRARFDPGSGMSRLITEKVTRAEATQRQGRAGRVAPGTAYRLWTKGEEGAMLAYPPAEIESADLTGLALELALWGAKIEDMAFLTPPNAGTFAEAQTVLRMLGALDDDNRITRHGRTLATIPLHPRLAHMLTVAGPDAAPLAALLAARDPPARGAPVDLDQRGYLLPVIGPCVPHGGGTVGHGDGLAAVFPALGADILRRIGRAEDQDILVLHLQRVAEIMGVQNAIVELVKACIFWNIGHTEMPCGDDYFVEKFTTFDISHLIATGHCEAAAIQCAHVAHDCGKTDHIADGSFLGPAFDIVKQDRARRIGGDRLAEMFVKCVIGKLEPLFGTIGP